MLGTVHGICSKGTDSEQFVESPVMSSMKALEGGNTNPDCDASPSAVPAAAQSIISMHSTNKKWGNDAAHDDASLQGLPVSNVRACFKSHKDTSEILHKHVR